MLYVLKAFNLIECWFHPLVCLLDAGTIAAGMLCQSDFWYDTALVFTLTMVSPVLSAWLIEALRKYLYYPNKSLY